jgi:hypothetical protein
MNVVRWLTRGATAMLVVLAVLYLGLTVYPAYGGGFDHPAAIGIYGVDPTIRPVPLFGDVTPTSTPSPTADRLPVAVVAVLIWVSFFGLCIPLSLVSAGLSLWFRSAFGPVERVSNVILAMGAAALLMTTLDATGNLMQWLMD